MEIGKPDSNWIAKMVKGNKLAIEIIEAGLDSRIAEFDHDCYEKDYFRLIRQGYSPKEADKLLSHNLDRNY